MGHTCTQCRTWAAQVLTGTCSVGPRRVVGGRLAADMHRVGQTCLCSAGKTCLCSAEQTCLCSAGQTYSSQAGKTCLSPAGKTCLCLVGQMCLCLAGQMCLCLAGQTRSCPAGQSSDLLVSGQSSGLPVSAQRDSRRRVPGQRGPWSQAPAQKARYPLMRAAMSRRSLAPLAQSYDARRP